MTISQFNHKQHHHYGKSFQHLKATFSSQSKRIKKYQCHSFEANDVTFTINVYGVSQYKISKIQFQIHKMNCRNLQHSYEYV